MKAFLFIFSLVTILAGCDNFAWDKLDKFKHFLTANKIDVENFINSTLDIIRDAIGPPSDFSDEIDRWIMPWENTSYNKPDCEFEFANREKLKSLFLIEMRTLEEPVRKRVEYLKKKLTEISTSVSMLGPIAQLKNRSCSISGDDCPGRIDSWIEESISALRCKILKNCQKHVINKRSKKGCSPLQFTCRNGECIDGDNICTGTKTCSDGSDEGPKCMKFCFNGFHCTNLKCIDKSLVCDGEDDCGDNSDEAHCINLRHSSHNCTLDLGMFLCKNRNCVTLAEACDGIDACGDGSDEGGLCGTGCPGGCGELGGVCVTTPRGPTCLNKCPPGSVDTASGCQLYPEPLPSTVEELVEEMPVIAEKCISSVYQLKQRIVSRLFQAYADFSQCYGDKSINKMIRLTKLNETYNSNNSYKIKLTTFIRTLMPSTSTQRNDV